MIEPGTAKETALRPWAAYVVGHHPYSIRGSQEILWQGFLDEFEPEDQQRRYDSIIAEFEELDRALEILADTDQVKPSELVRYQRASGRFEERCFASIKSPWTV